MGDVLVIGYGSDLRRDDAVGRLVAEEIERRSLPGVTAIACTQLLPELVAPLSDAALVVFVDASLGAPCLSVRPVCGGTATTGSHHTTPEGLLGLAAALHLPRPAAVLVEVPVCDLSLGEGLSEPTEARFTAAVEAVVELCAGAGGRQRPPTAPPTS